jgi:hypothetical protein
VAGAEAEAYISFYSGNSMTYLIKYVSITEKLDIQENVPLNNYKHISKTLG